MILSDMQTRLLERLGENPSAPAFYTVRETVAWLNAAQRFMVLLTLCLEATATVVLTGAFQSMLGQFPDWLLPLRIRVAGVKLKPSRFSDLAALDTAWSASPGPAVRYAHVGFDFLGLYQQPGGGASCQVTYARCPAALASSGDVPEVPPEYHPALIEGAIPLLRAKEGGQEWKKVLADWDKFMDACQQLGERVRARNVEQGFDRMPVELARFDRSKMLMEAAGGK